MKDRIRQLMEAQHMNQQTFAQYTGIGSASLSSIFTGRTNPSLKHVQLILAKFPDVNPLWLLQGQGGMLQVSGENSDNNATSGNISHETTSIGLHSSKEESLFGSANMASQPSLFDTPSTAQPRPAALQVSQKDNPTVPQRKITEIRIFYDDQTWETFTPKK